MFTRHPPRSLEHSIISTSKDAFAVIRNLKTSGDPNQAVTRRENNDEFNNRMKQQMWKAETAARVTEALWSIAMQLENESVGILNSNNDEGLDEPVSVPPVTTAVSRKRERKRE